MANKIGILGKKLLLTVVLPAIIVLIITGVVCVLVLSQNKLESIRQSINDEIVNSDTNVYNTLETIKNNVKSTKDHNMMYNYINNYNNDENGYYYKQVYHILNAYCTEFTSAGICASWMVDFKNGISLSGDGTKDFTPKDTATSEELFEQIKTCGGEAYYSRVYNTELCNDANAGQRVLSVVCPIVDWKNGNSVIGAYGVEVLFSKLDGVMKTAEFNDVISIICDKEYKAEYSKVAHNDEYYSKLQKVVDSVKDGKTSFVRYNGKKYMAVTTYMPKTQLNEVCLVNYGEIVGDINGVVIPIIIFIAAACIVISAIMLNFIFRFVSNLNSFTVNTLKIIDGNYSNKMIIDSNDEFGQLALAYNDTIDHLKYVAEHDDITGVYNISTFYTKAAKMINMNRDPSIKCAIVRLDIDHFRVINDIYNWQVGNNVLKYIADSIKTYVDENTGVIGRISGDVFVVCMQYINETEIEEKINKIKDRIMEYDIMVNLNPHFGIYLEAESDLPVHLMCDRAGIALSLIKGNLLQTISYYDNTVSKMNMDIKFIETNTQTAFAEKQFFIQLQPKYNMKTNKIVGAEALVRWKHPVKGIIKPDTFIPIFEKNGNIIKLDEFVWEETCRCISKWLKMGLDVFPISVNVSRIHIYNKHLVEELCDLVEKYDIPTRLLQLEFTESALLDDTKELYNTINKLKEKNFTLLMDDFASGYSSLNTLKAAPFDIVKLDKEFISAVAENKRDRMLVASAISMIDKQRMEIVVEGVETREQVGILLQSGCDIAQGYFFSKPIDVDTFEKLAFGIE